MPKIKKKKQKKKKEEEEITKSTSQTYCNTKTTTTTTTSTGGETMGTATMTFPEITKSYEFGNTNLQTSQIYIHFYVIKLFLAFSQNPSTCLMFTQLFLFS